MPRASVVKTWLRNINYRPSLSLDTVYSFTVINISLSPVTFNIRYVDIPVNENFKVLRIHIDDKLKLDVHFSELCKRASRHLNAISCVSKFLDEKCRISLHSFILSHFHYCNIVWHTCDTENTIKIQKIQKRALRVILNDYDELLDKIDQPLMYISRLKNIVLETFKSVHKINPPFMQDLLEVKENEYNLRGGILLDQPKVCTERHGIHTIRYQGARLWNSLPSHMKTSVTVEDFKYNLAKSTGPACKCGYCLSCKLPQI